MKKNIIKIINGVLIILLTVYIIYSILSLKSNVAALEEGVNQEELQQQISNLEYNFKTYKTALDINQMQLIELWLITLEPEALDKLTVWENANGDAVSCDKGEYDVVIGRNYFDYNISVARTLIHIFKNGEMVYERTGEVHCHLYPISDMNPPAVDCNLLCLENEEG